MFYNPLNTTYLVLKKQKQHSCPLLDFIRAYYFISYKSLLQFFRGSGILVISFPEKSTR